MALQFAGQQTEASGSSLPRTKANCNPLAPFDWGSSVAIVHAATYYNIIIHEKHVRDIFSWSVRLFAGLETINEQNAASMGQQTGPRKRPKERTGKEKVAQRCQKLEKKLSAH